MLTHNVNRYLVIFLQITIFQVFLVETRHTGCPSGYPGRTNLYFIIFSTQPAIHSLSLFTMFSRTSGHQICTEVYIYIFIPIAWYRRLGYCISSKAIDIRGEPVSAAGEQHSFGIACTQRLPNKTTAAVGQQDGESQRREERIETCAHCWTSIIESLKLRNVFLITIKIHEPTARGTPVEALNINLLLPVAVARWCGKWYTFFSPRRQRRLRTLRRL